MNILILAVASSAFAAALNLSSAWASGRVASSGPGVVKTANGELANNEAGAFHPVGRHPRYVGYWVLEQ
jgi:hypothetical protein